MMTLALSLSARGSSNREDDLHRIEDSAQIFQEIMGTPDKAIPQDLLESAQCIAVIPAEKKLAFVVGGNYGKGSGDLPRPQKLERAGLLDSERREFGFQIGGSSTDIILVFRGRRGLKQLLSDKFKIGGDASAAAGPVGRSAAAGTDIALHAKSSPIRAAGAPLPGSVLPVPSCNPMIPAIKPCTAPTQTGKISSMERWPFRPRPWFLCRQSVKQRAPRSLTAGHRSLMAKCCEEQ